MMELRSISTVATQLMIKRLFPSAVLMPADSNAAFNLPLRLVKTATAALEAARRRTVARIEVNALATMARGIQQLKMFRPFVRIMKSNARMYAVPRNWESVPYDGMEVRPLEPCIPVESSFRLMDGLKLKPKCGVVQVMEEFVSVQDVNRETVVQFPMPSEAAVALDPTRSVPVSFEMSERYVELESFEEIESASVFACERQYPNNGFEMGRFAFRKNQSTNTCLFEPAMRTRRIKILERPKSPNEMKRAPLICAFLSQLLFSIQRAEISRETKGESARDIHKVIRKSLPQSSIQTSLLGLETLAHIWWLRLDYVADVNPQVNDKGVMQPNKFRDYRPQGRADVPPPASPPHWHKGPQVGGRLVGYILQ